MFENFPERGQENGSLAEKLQLDKDSKMTWQRNERGNMKGESNDCTKKIPDRRMLIPDRA